MANIDAIPTQWGGGGTDEELSFVKKCAGPFCSFRKNLGIPSVAFKLCKLFPNATHLWKCLPSMKNGLQSHDKRRWGLPHTRNKLSV